MAHSDPDSVYHVASGLLFTVSLRLRNGHVAHCGTVNAEPRGSLFNRLQVHVAQAGEMTHAPAPKRRVSQDGDSSADEADSGPPPPDGGWGWMVVFASFMIHIVTDGVTYSFGVLYKEFLLYFGESNAKTSLIASILVGTTLCSGPVSSSLVNKYGCRAVTIGGAIFGFLCLIVATFAQNVEALCVTIGFGAGLGFGLIYLPAIVSVTCYFERYRSLATGIAVCGSGLGTFIFAPLTKYLIDEYGWRGAVLIISSLVLQCTTFGALFRPLEEFDSHQKTRFTKEPQYLATNVVDIQNRSEHDIGTSKSNGGIQRPLSMGNFTMPRHVLQPLNPKQNDVNETARLALSQPALVNLATTSAHSTEPSRHNFGSQSLRHSGIMYRKDVFYRASLHNIPQHARTAVHRSNMRLAHEKPPEVNLLVPKRNVEAKSEEVYEAKNGKLCGVISCSKETRDTLYEMLNFSLLKDPIFILFTVSNFCTSIGFNIPYVYIELLANSHGVPEDSSNVLLSVIGIANTIGRVILGYVSDKPWINRLHVYNISLALCGLVTALTVVCYDLYSFAACMSIYGFTIGAYVGLTSVILVDLLGLERLTNAFGVLLLFQGIASFAGPPIAGSLFDTYKSYNHGFIFAGVMIAASGLILYVIPPLQRHLGRRKSPDGLNGNTPLDLI